MNSGNTFIVVAVEWRFLHIFHGKQVIYKTLKKLQKKILLRHSCVSQPFG